MGKINVLSFEVANLIAAGEVVDRPASVIKELVENSIDSGADRITVEIQRGGIMLMRVTDNGCGMSPDDLPVAVKRHATSKIKTAQDLDGISTLGFRGEALAAICSVADVRIISKTRDAALGAMLEINSGRTGEITERGATDGTTVIVENLFANVPARLKFLKRDQTEAMAVATVVEKIALSHPEIAFRLISDGAIKLETAGDGKLAGAIRSVYGKDFAAKTIPVEATREGIEISGFITSPDAPRANRNYQNFFINGRYIKTKTATAAIEQAYSSYIPPDKFPGCILNITLSPSVVDVNVHPSKLEVKFSNERPVFDVVYHAVRSALQENRQRPELELGGGTKMNFAGGASFRVSSAFVPVRDKRLEGGEKPHAQMNIAEAYSQPAPTAIPRAETPVPPVINDRPLRASVNVTEKETVILPEKKPSIPDIPNISYRIVGELFNSYVIVEKESSMLVIDKHAAHERLNFEKMKKLLYSAERTSQQIAVPIEIMLMSDEVSAIEDYRQSIEGVGFEFQTTKNTVYVNAIPTGIAQKDVSAMFEGFADAIKNNTGNVEINADDVFEKALYQASCKASIKAGRTYPQEYIEKLVQDLFENPEITYCPHGRPVAFEISRNELNHRFKRS
ncbi:MAG: DNA mismatch repair endonuclease MutL [Clostridia bacterium]|nr:DNA mismatch repair endonuclease MutL [Clostridia bacterium]